MASNPYSRSTIEGHTIDGNVFTNQISLTIPAGATGYYNVYIPAVSVASIVIMGRDVVSNSGDGFELRIFANPTGVVYGTPINNRNANTRSSKTSDVVIRPVTSLTSPGTEVEFTLLPAGGFKSGGAYPAGSIRVYAEGNYLIGIKNLSNATQKLYAEYVWVQLQTLLDF